MRTIFIGLFIFIITACNNNKQRSSDSSSTEVFKIPAQVSADHGNTDSIKHFTLVSAGQASPSNNTTIYGCKFEIAAANGDTIYWATSDTNFITPEGYKTGDRLDALPKSIQKQLVREAGWGYYYSLSSGWQLGFCEGNSCTDHYPLAGSKVKWVFKRR